MRIGLEVVVAAALALNLGDCMAVGICRSLGQILGCFVCLVWKVRVE